MACDHLVPRTQREAAEGAHAVPQPSHPRIKLAHLPTPLEPLDRLSEMLGGPRIFIKRDDCTGLAFGGNKTRKLEYLFGDALEQGADCVITTGGLQSNHVRQTAAAANRLGMAGHLVLQRYVDRTDQAYQASGNLLLDCLLGAIPHFVAPDGSRDAEITRLADSLSGQGAKPYVIPSGGSNPVGGLGYAAAARELLDQAAAQGLDLGHVVIPTASGGTQGGLVAGFAHIGATVEVSGIDVDVKDSELRNKIVRVANGTAALLGMEEPDLDGRVSVIEGYGGESYGIPTEEMIEALRLLARLEGIVLDPVYSGKAMAGLIDLVKQSRFEAGNAVVFIHTGGLPGLFAYAPLFPSILPEGI